MWRPLITDAEERARILGIVDEIADAVEAVPRTRMSSHRDLAVMNAYLSRDAIEHVAAAIAEPAHSLGLYGGLAGVGWTISHLASDENAEEMCTQVDAALLQALDAWEGPFDLISGLVGFGVYALERQAAGHALAARVMTLLEERSQRRGAGLAWKTPPHELPPHQLVGAPDGYWNLGLAHGIPGIVAFTARCVAYGVEEARARELMNGAVRYLLDAEAHDDAGRFPAWHLPDGSGTGGRARLAWCYGDLGVAAALLAAAHVEPRWHDDARRLARACASRTPPSRDTGLCHGSAGVAHAFNRMYQSTGDEVFGEAARRWLATTLAMRNDHAYGGFPAFDVELDNWREDASLLSGAAGVALALHAMVSDVEPMWDRMLLLDL